MSVRRRREASLIEPSRPCPRHPRRVQARGELPACLGRVMDSATSSSVGIWTIRCSRTARRRESSGSSRTPRRRPPRSRPAPRPDRSRRRARRPAARCRAARARGRRWRPRRPPRPLRSRCRAGRHAVRPVKDTGARGPLQPLPQIAEGRVVAGDEARAHPRDRRRVPDRASWRGSPRASRGPASGGGGGPSGPAARGSPRPCYSETITRSGDSATRRSMSARGRRGSTPACGRRRWSCRSRHETRDRHQAIHRQDLEQDLVGRQVERGDAARRLARAGHHRPCEQDDAEQRDGRAPRRARALPHGRFPPPAVKRRPTRADRPSAG